MNAMKFSVLMVLIFCLLGASIAAAEQYTLRTLGDVPQVAKVNEGRVCAC